MREILHAAVPGLWTQPKVLRTECFKKMKPSAYLGSDAMATPATGTNISAIESVYRKIDLFFQLHILPVLDPTKIHWHFSLSGGKDSFVMANAVKNWYVRQNLRVA